MLRCPWTGLFDGTEIRVGFERKDAGSERYRAGRDPDRPMNREGQSVSIESRVDFFLRAADRADREGNPRLAAIFRKMAEELGPPELGLTLPEPPGSPS